MTTTRGSEACECCGAEATVTRGDYHFVESGLQNVWLSGVELVHCESCGNEDPVIPRVGEMMQMLALAIAEKPCRLEGAEVKFLRKHVRQTQQELASLLGVEKTIVSKWENNDDAIGTQSERLLRMIAIGLHEGQQEKVGEVISSFAKIEACSTTKRININTIEPSFAYA